MAIKSIITILALVAATVFGGRLSNAKRLYLTPKQLAIKKFKLCTTYNQIKDEPEYKLKPATRKQFAAMCNDPKIYEFKASFRG